MSRRFTFFTLFVWNPLMVLSGALVAKQYGQQIATSGVLGVSMAFYAYAMMFFAPGLWDLFVNKGG